MRNMKEFSGLTESLYLYSGMATHMYEFVKINLTVHLRSMHFTVGNSISGKEKNPKKTTTKKQGVSKKNMLVK